MAQATAPFLDSTIPLHWLDEIPAMAEVASRGGYQDQRRGRGLIDKANVNEPAGRDSAANACLFTPAVSSFGIANSPSTVREFMRSKLLQDRLILAF